MENNKSENSLNKTIMEKGIHLSDKTILYAMWKNHVRQNCSNNNIISNCPKCKVMKKHLCACSFRTFCSIIDNNSFNIFKEKYLNEKKRLSFLLLRLNVLKKRVKNIT